MAQASCLTSACSPTPLRDRYSCQNRLCNAARLEADLGKLAARLTRRALGDQRVYASALADVLR